MMTDWVSPYLTYYQFRCPKCGYIKQSDNRDDVYNLKKCPACSANSYPLHPDELKRVWGDDK